MKRRFFLLAAPAIVAAPSLMKVRTPPLIYRGAHLEFDDSKPRIIIVGRDAYNVLVEEILRTETINTTKFKYIEKITITT